MNIVPYAFELAEVDVRDCNSRIRTDIHDLRLLYGTENVQIYKWNDDYISVVLTISVNLPTRGPVGNVDVRESEPIVLLFHKTRYPHKAPLVFSNRSDFPVRRLPHLNPALPGLPARFCLHRGNTDDWFAENSVLSLIERIQSWLRDAASNRLIREHDRFEPTRIDLERWVGMAVYDPAILQDFVSSSWADGKREGVALLPCDVLGQVEQDTAPEHSSFALRIGVPLPLDVARKLRADTVDTKHGSGTKHGKLGSALLGLLVWTEEDRLCDEYFGHLPDTLESLTEFADRLGLPLRSAIDRFLAEEIDRSTILPLVLAIQRPQPLVGSNSQIELINLVLVAKSERDHRALGKRLDSPVFLLSNRSPMTVKLARELSASRSSSKSSRVLVIGCGALGSKIGLHLARAGVTELTLVDNDTLSPHNLVRHGLLAGSVGDNKAVGLAKAVRAMFSDDQSNVQIDTMPTDALDILFSCEEQCLKEYHWILDCSASTSVLNALVDSRLGRGPRVVRTEIAAAGRLGILMVEGIERNPRVDDLQMALYDLAVDDDVISLWLQEQQAQTQRFGSALEEITVGLGCSSATMRIADDIISYHASVAAMSVRDKLTRGTAASGLQISCWDMNETNRGAVKFVACSKYRVLIPRRASGWTVRISESLCTQLQKEVEANAPNETGGLLLGFIHYKRKTVYVTRIMDPPPDSVGSPYAFRLGVKDVPERLDEIQKTTGGLIGYVGEWHSHPHGSSRMSSEDKAAMRQISSHLKAAGLPVHIMIVTPKGCYPHLFHYR